ncbi:unnamed protein product [Closterium sp. NIES-54]
MAVVEEPLYPIAILIDELKNDDIQLRLNSIRRLSTIARALGDDRTRKELIPFLNENNDDDDEVLLAMAEELGSFIPYVGGVDYAPVLLPPLETLCTVEETVVRDKAVESLCKIGQQMKPRDVVEFFVPLVQRLGAGEWFTARVSACGLFHIAYPSATEQQRADLRTLYGQLSHDDMPMVRRSSALNMGKFAATVEPQFLKLDILEFFKDLTNDDQDSVRLLAVEGCAAVGKLLEKKDCISSILPVILSFAQDKSWRVRYMVANQLHELCEAVGPEVARAELVPAYVKLLRDNEAEVRIAAAGKVTKICAIVKNGEAFNVILPCVKDLSTDTSQHVRSALASVIMGMAPLLGKELTIETLLPIFLALLKDEFPDVRLNIISKLDQVNQVIGMDLLSQSLLPAIVELSEDRHWRVRLAIIEYIPLLAGQLGMEFFDEKLKSLCMQWLEDQVYSIREAAATNLKRLAEEFGAEWAQSQILPMIMDKVNNSHYLYRMTVLLSLSMLAPVLGAEATCNTMLPVILNAAKDGVPNIRFNVAKMLQSFIPIVEPSVVEQTIRPCLLELNEDPDPDTLEDWYKQMPIITRSYLTLSFLTTAGCALEVISPFSVYFNSNLIFKKFQLWRLFTNFFFFGSIGIDFVFHMFFLCRYCKLLEETSFRGRTADFFFMLLFGGVLLTMVAPFVNIQFLGSSLTFMMVYVWGRRNPNIQMSFLGLFNFTAPYLPWVLLGFSVLLGSSPVVDLLGMAAGHVYYFLVDVYPKISGRQLLKTPGILKVLFPPDDVVVAFPPEEAGFDQAAGVNGHM